MKKFALIKWTDGEDKGAYSTIEITWIKGITLEDITELEKSYIEEVSLGLEDSDNEERVFKNVYVCEWRVGKRPEGGWDSFEAEILQISEKKSEVEKLFKKMTECVDKQVLRNEKRVVVPPRKNYSPVIPPQTKTSSKKNSLFPSTSVLQQQLLEKYTKNDVEIPDGEELSKVKKQCKKLKTELDEARKLLINELPALFTKCDRVLDRLNEIQCPQQPISLSSANSDSNLPKDTTGLYNCADKMVEVCPGSGVYCKSISMASIQQATTYSAMTRLLLLALFDNDILLKSNLKGGKPKNSKNKNVGNDENLEIKMALDPIKLEALYQCVLIKFPNTAKSLIGTSISNKLGDLRAKADK